MSRITLYAVLILVLSSVLSNLPTGNFTLPRAHASLTPTLQVWNPAYGSNLTSLSAFGPGSRFTVSVNITGAGPITAFDLTLDYGMVGLLPPVTTSTGSISLSPGIFDGTSLPSGCRALIVKRSVIPDPFDTIRVIAVIIGGCTVDGNGTLFSVTFDVTGQGATSLHLVRAANAVLSPLVLGPPPTFAPIAPRILDAYFRNVPGIPPIARFTYTPSLPNRGDTIVFDATGSYDPDNTAPPNNGISKYIWSFGDLVTDQVTSTGSVSHEFLFAPTVPASGYFEVRLVVNDTDNSIPSEYTAVVYVNPGVIHDVAVAVSVNNVQVVPSEPVQLTVAVFNRGNQNENVNLTVTYDLNGETLIANTIFLLPVVANNQFTYTIQTNNLGPRVYTVTASAQLLNAIDANPQDNIALISFEVIPPPPEILVSDFFTTRAFDPLPRDPNSNPKVDVVLANGIVKSTKPNQILAWVNVTNIGQQSLRSLEVIQTLPTDWAISPPWLPAMAAIHVYFEDATSLSANTEITQASNIIVFPGNPQTVHLVISNLTDTTIGHPLMPGQSILMSVTLSYGLRDTIQSASSYPRNYMDRTFAIAWTQASFTGPFSTDDRSALFIIYAKVLGNAKGDSAGSGNRGPNIDDGAIFQEDS